MKYINKEELNNIEELIKINVEKGRTICKASNKINEKVWKEPEVDMRNRWIISQVVKNGMSLNDVRAYMRQNWGVGYTTSENYMKTALGSLAEMDKDNKNIALAVHRERLEDLYSRAVENNKIDSALRVLEQMAKVNGYYNDTMVVNMPVMQFKFGDDDNLIMYKNEREDTSGVQTV